MWLISNDTKDKINGIWLNYTWIYIFIKSLSALYLLYIPFDKTTFRYRGDMEVVISYISDTLSYGQFNINQ